MKYLIFVLIAVLSLLPVMNAMAEDAQNPHAAEWLDEAMKQSLDTIRRVDDRGVLYEMTYTADYSSPAVLELVDKAAAALNTGCSAYSAYNTSGEFMLCRNYDYMHRDAEGNPTGLQVVIHFAPEGKLKSIGICDAFWLNPAAYYAGALDDGVTDTSAMILSPYMCVDGMNEAGLTASLLVVDLKAGETYTNQNTGKTRVMQSVLLRHIMDNAHNIEEAVEVARSYDVYSTGITDLHLYLTEKDGSSAVLEWRQYGDDDKQELYVTYTNACTNFFVGFDDGEDSYKADGSLREQFARFSTTFNSYLYGYGHGYHRFNTIVASLERYIMDESNEHGIRNSIMEEDQMLDVLRVISQNPGTEKTSFTQYSALYHLNSLSVTLWLQRNYEVSYTFELN